MEFKSADIRTWSILGQRGTFGLALQKLAAETSSVVAMTADLCNTAGLARFRQSFPERFLNVGIAEQDLIGAAAGASQCGDTVFAATFANFAALRACEQIRHFLGYMGCNVKVVGLSAGFGMEFFGVTHYGLEDVAALRAIPRLVILSPADGAETVKAVAAAAEHPGPVYIRLTGVMNQPMVYRRDFAFAIGQANRLRDGADAAVYATGSMVRPALDAAELLSAGGVECAVWDMHTLKPLDAEALRQCAGKRLAVTVEEHSITGGLGGAAAEFLAGEGGMPPLLRLGVEDGYPRAGDYSYMLESCGLTKDAIAKRISDTLTGGDRYHDQ